MSKVITFNARDFKFDKTCTGGNVGSRMFVTDIFGENVEAYEIGSFGNWTQIASDKVLEKDTDYVFRFGITGGNEYTDGASRFIVMPIAGEEADDEDWENRYTYNLAQNQYQAKIVKKWNNAPFRVYEIPFNTGNTEKVRFIFVEQNVPAKIYPVAELSEYAKLADYSYNGWLSDKMDQLEKLKNIEFPIKDINIKDIDVEGTVRGASDTIRNAVDKFSSSFLNGVANFADSFANAAAGFANAHNSDHNCTIENEDLDANEFALKLNDADDGWNIRIENTNIKDVDNDIDLGSALDGCNFVLTNVVIGGKTYVALMKKVGDGCNVSMVNVTVDQTDAELDIAGISSDGCNISAENLDISEGMFAGLVSKIGDGCNVTFNNVTVIGDGTDYEVGCAVDGTVFVFEGVMMPFEMKRKILNKIGDGCEVKGL